MLNIVNDFPLLCSYNRDGRIVYADSAATTQKPHCVIDAVTEWYSARNANPHRGSYKLGVLATDIYEYSRSVAAKHIQADKDEVVFCRNTTEAINLAARCFAPRVLRRGNEIVVPISEHHSNLVPWQELARRYGCRLVYLLTDRNGRIPEEEIEKKITSRTRIVAVAQVSNVLGICLPIAHITQKAHEVGAYVLVDAAQGILHYGLDVKTLGADFAAFSAHKAFGPDGIGILWGRKQLLQDMPPLYFGGEMVKSVSWRRARFEKVPLRFEAGTQNASGAFAFSVALQYIEHIGQKAIKEHEVRLTKLLLEGIREIPNLVIYGDPEYAEDRSCIISFNFSGQSPLLVSRCLDYHGITVRAGTHCAQPLMEYLGTNGVCRISLAPYNTEQDVENIISALRDVPNMIVKTALRKTK